MTRRCSHCSNNGSEGGGGVRLFGVKLTDGCVMKKSASMGNLSSLASSSPLPPRVLRDDGYLSDDPAADRRGGDRKKGVPWTEEEHRMFLNGLQKLGKGDWRGIAQKYVMTRTPTQVASHAQKYFIRQSNSNRRKRRSSLFDMDPDTAMDPPYMPEEHALLPSHEEEREYEDSNVLPSLNLSLGSECSRPIESTQEDKIFIKSDKQSVMGFNGYPNGYPPAIPGYIPVYLPVPYPVWRSASPLIKGNTQNRGGTSLFPRILKPVPIHSKEPINVDALVGLSQLNLGEAERLHNYPSPLSMESLGGPSRQSAFHPMLQPVNQT